MIKYAEGMLPFLSLFVFLDGFQGVCSGILRGTGKQSIGATVNILAYYLIGLPMAWVMCFKLNFGINGLMIGLSFGTEFQVGIFLYVVLFMQKQLFFNNVESNVSTAYEKLEDNDILTDEIA